MYIVYRCASLAVLLFFLEVFTFGGSYISPCTVFAQQIPAMQTMKKSYIFSYYFLMHHGAMLGSKRLQQSPHCIWFIDCATSWSVSTLKDQGSFVEDRTPSITSQSSALIFLINIKHKGNRLLHEWSPVRTILFFHTWRIIPVSKWLVTPIYKPFRPFIRGPITPFRGRKLTMVINQLVNGMILQVCPETTITFQLFNSTTPKKNHQGDRQGCGPPYYQRTPENGKSRKISPIYLYI